MSATPEKEKSRQKTASKAPSPSLRKAAKKAPRLSGQLADMTRQARAAGRIRRLQHEVARRFQTRTPMQQGKGGANGLVPANEPSFYEPTVSTPENL